MLLGIDFDNTIIKYDELFHKVAYEKKLIPFDLPKQKNAVRDYLRKENIEDEWTMIQGEVYSNRINEAIPYPGMKETLIEIRSRKIPIKIISHKTQFPYMGPKNDLHKSAFSWLETNKFFEKDLGFNRNDIFFETTKENKINRILKTECTYYLDDLPEILSMIPRTIKRMNFSPNNNKIKNSEWIVINKWTDLLKVIL